MEFLDKRIQVICDELQRLSVRQRAPITAWQIKPGNYLTPAEADAAEAPYALFDHQETYDLKKFLTGGYNGQPYEAVNAKIAHWYGPDQHYWFRTEVAVPESYAGRSLYLHLQTQIEEWDDAKNPQFLVFVDGQVTQGADMNHRDILLAEHAEAGRTYRIDLQAYTGILHAELSLLADIREIDPEIEGLFYDLVVPLRAFGRLDPDGQPRHKLEHVLNEAVNLLDLRTPYDENFDRTVREARAYLAKALYTDLAGHDEVIASCIGHTHIDVAWWWTVAQTEEKTCRSFATVLHLMDQYPNYRFMSSQPQLYAFLKARYPELFEQIKARVAEGRWEPEGGMWVEADCNLTSGESLVRQFIYGKRFFKNEFGKDNRVLWLPDVFGYSGALPQIMKQCGIDYFMTTKLAWNQVNKIPYDTFMWRGIDGTEVLTHLVTTVDLGQDPTKNFFTTYNGQLHPDSIMGGWQRYQQKDINNDILISYGYGDGGGGPTRDMLETSKRMEKGILGIPKVRQVFARQFFEELDQRVSHNRRLPTWEGELYFEYHRGTLTSMGRNKRANRKCELGMMDLELLSVLAAPQLDYPQEEMDALWRVILINQFHDILPGSSIHEVYEVTKKEYAETAGKIAALTAERLAALTPEGEGVTVFNTTGFERDDIVELGENAPAALQDETGRVYPVQRTENGAVAYLTGLPAKGLRSYSAAPAAAAQTPFTLSADGHVLETPFYTVRFDEYGQMASLFDKENRREVFKPGQPGNALRAFEDKPMYYDNWDVDVFYTEKSWDVTGLTAFTWTENGPVRATLHIERPYSHSVIKQDIHFYADSRRIDFDNTVDWNEHQTLLKAFFPANVHTDYATFDVQFGNLTRKTFQNTSWDRARFESCGQKWCDVSEGHYGVSVLNDCKYGHSVKEGCIGLTLIKSGVEPNPVTDQETHWFTYALYPHAEGWQQAGTVRQAYFVNQKALAARGGAAAPAQGLASVDAPNVVLETVKQAEDGDGVILRLYECDNALTPVTLTWNRPFHAAHACNCLEEPAGEVETAGRAIRFTMKPYEIKTIRIQW